MPGTGKRLLVISSPTIDIIARDGRAASVRPGGPTLYIAAAANRYGYKVYAIGSIGVETLPTLSVERMLGVERLCCLRSRRGAVFMLEYRGNVRVDHYLGDSVSLGYDNIMRAVEAARPDIIIFSPVYNEVHGSQVSTLYQAYGACVGLDLQGLHRTMLTGSLPTGAAGFIHGTVEETPVGAERLGFILAATRGADPFYLKIGNGRPIRVDPPSVRLPDPTGAGDVFLFGLLHYACTEHEPPGTAARLASRLVADMLPIVQSMIQRAMGPAGFGDLRVAAEHQGY